MPSSRSQRLTSKWALKPGKPASSLDGDECETDEADICPESSTDAKPVSTRRTGLQRSSRVLKDVTNLPSPRQSVSEQVIASASEWKGFVIMVDICFQRQWTGNDIETGATPEQKKKKPNDGQEEEEDDDAYLPTLEEEREDEEDEEDVAFDKEELDDEIRQLLPRLFEDVEDDDFLALDAEAEVDIEPQCKETEEEEEQEGEVEVPSTLQDSLKRKSHGASCRPAKKARRCPVVSYTAEEWIAHFDSQKKNLVAEDDPDFLRFQSNFGALIRGACLAAADTETEPMNEWMMRPKEEREMTRGFRSVLARISSKDLQQEVFSHMPRMAQKILGKKDLKPVDLLDLPLFPSMYKHRAAYLNVPTRIEAYKITRGDSPWTKAKIRVPVNEQALQTPLDTRVYAGSTNATLGGYTRVGAHERATHGDKSQNHDLAKHYKFASQPDVVLNFRLVATWSNPFAAENPGDQDLTRWLSVFVEAMTITYLGLYNRSDRCASLGSLFSRASYELSDSLRKGVDLPAFGEHSLNRAWPLMQGVAGGMSRADSCANPNCALPLESKHPELPSYLTCKMLCSSEGPMGLKYCVQCTRFACMNGGTMRTRAATANGFFDQELGRKLESINDSFLGNGNPRQCRNTSCRVNIPDSASLYGLANGIRCHRCHEFRERRLIEWSPLDYSGIDANPWSDPKECSACGVHTDDVHVWDRGLSRLCQSCNEKRCSFGEQMEPSTPQPHTVVACFNETCQRRKGLKMSMTRMIEDVIENVWRCLICDWEFCESLHDYDVRREIPHHRYNLTSCVSCGRFHTYDKWKKVEGGYKCGECVLGDSRCANAQCPRHRAVFAERKKWDPVLQDWFCDWCFRSNAQRPDDKKSKNFHAVNRYVVGTRVCVNPHCGHTDETWSWSWVYQEGHKGNPEYLRCAKCHNHLREHGEERRPHANRTSLGPTTCFNCKGTEETLGPQMWRTVLDADGHPTAQWRCDKCHSYWFRHKEERTDDNLKRKPVPTTRECANPNCDTTGEVKRGWSKTGTDENGNDIWRCKGCTTYWKRTGRDRTSIRVNQKKRVVEKKKK
ncbi:uncharacterized protein F5Z01DRAFT_693364 [Emericellopsis atlantica]|uniref:Uncharacterized protein n=1 Tax=Emericellopsis atlantica TaxID=2614577 RepID=A0A9P7ZGI1_9HYPO|nr:uncharacterized protein F5Z01DRAFT_693364 [Emericellopsis atlantica]KAG9251043.1 hypothetical protein F5Z01DRAFT_693364 [Emericellopsis atlantica]